MGLEITFCSSMLSFQGKGQVASRRSVPRSITIPPNDPECEHAEERGRKTKTTKLIASGIGLTWIRLERVNPSPSCTHLVKESEWCKVDAVPNAATGCSRETELIRVL
ncbi:hypothetical protein H5410_003289, partial [Solanum commersonii]